MTGPVPTDGQLTPRPRRTPVPPPAGNGSAAQPTFPGAPPPDTSATFTPEERRMLRALEEVRAAKLALDAGAAQSGADTTAYGERLTRQLDDIDAIDMAPFPQRLAQMRAPDEPDASLVDGLI